MSVNLREVAIENGWQTLQTDEMTAAYRGPAAIVWHTKGQARGEMRLGRSVYQRGMTKAMVLEELVAKESEHLPVALDVLMAVLGTRLVEMTDNGITLLDPSELQTRGHLKADHDVNPMLADMLSDREMAQLHAAAHMVDLGEYGRYSRRHFHTPLNGGAS